MFKKIVKLMGIGYIMKTKALLKSINESKTITTKKKTYKILYIHKPKV